MLLSFIRCKLWTNLSNNGQNEQFLFTGLYFIGNGSSISNCFLSSISNLDSIQYEAAKSEYTIFKIYYPGNSS